MPAQALAAPGYRWRLAIIAIVCLLLALWFTKDGFISYPQYNEHVKYFKAISENSNYSQSERDQKIQEYAHQNGIEAKDYHNPKRPWDFYSQYICLGIAAPIGLLFLIAWVRSKRSITSDPNGLTTSWGESAPFASMVRLNKERWRTKGIAVVTYRGEDQIEHKLVLDDWKYQALPTREILMEVEGHLRDEQIVGGERERLPESGPAPENVDS